MTNRQLAIAVGIAALLVPVALALIVFPTPMIDTRELFAWGRFFPLATHKHPPLMALVGGLVELVLPPNGVSAILVGQILNAVGICYLYATLLLVIDRDRAAFFTLLFATSLYFQLAPLSYALNADILQVPIWLAFVFHAIRAAETNRIGHWLALGAWAAAAVLTKYTAGLLFAAAAIAVLATPAWRRLWQNPRLYLAIAFGVLLIVPHLLALRSNSLAIGYAEHFATASPGFGARLVSLALFAGGTLLFLAPGWIIVATGLVTGNCTIAPAPAEAPAAESARRFLVALALATVGISVALVTILGTLFNHRYGAPLFGFFVMAVAPYIAMRPATFPAAERATIWAAGLVAAAVFAGTLVTYGIFTSHNYLQEPTGEAAAIVRAEWDKHYTCGPGYFLGDRPSAHGLSLASDRRAAGIPIEDIALASWFDPELLKRDGAIVVFRSPIPSEAVAAALPGTELTGEQSFTLPLLRTFSGSTITYRYAFISPRSCAIATPS